MSKLALVLSAGGARGAYEAGVLHYVRTGLPKKIAARNFQIYCGTSVGAINTLGMVALAHDPLTQSKWLKHMWFHLKQDNIYRRDISAASHLLGSTFGSLLKNLFTFNPFQIHKGKEHPFESFLDTAPLKKYLEINIPWEKLHDNISHGPVDAVAINVTNLTNGRNELFLSKKKEIPYKGNYIHHDGPIKPEHILASAAIPIIFPPQKIGKSYYADGGLRLFTPMSPAIQLGADRVLVVGLRKRVLPHHTYLGRSRGDKSTPTIPQQLGRMLNGLFLDRIEFDMEQLARINAMIEAGEKVYGKDYMTKMNRQMKKTHSELDIGMRGVRKIQGLEIQPSRFINEIFLECFESKEKDFKFSALEKMLIRFLDIDPASGSDLLSYLIFSPHYIREIFELGYQDAKSRRKDLIDLMGE